jgi:acyl dehydratase
MELDGLAELEPWVGREFGVSEWTVMTEELILAFGRLSGDQHWIHSDPARARAESPSGGIVAHGYLTLSLVTAMFAQCLTVRSATRWLNAGLNRLRFIQPVLPGMRLRGRFSLLEAVWSAPGQMRLVVSCTVEIEGNRKPAMVVEIIKVAFER